MRCKPRRLHDTHMHKQYEIKNYYTLFNFILIFLLSCDFDLNRSMHKHLQPEKRLEWCARLLYVVHSFVRTHTRFYSGESHGDSALNGR